MTTKRKPAKAAVERGFPAASGSGLTTPADIRAGIQDEGDFDNFEALGLAPEQARAMEAEAERQTAQSDADVDVEARINFRWGKPQLAAVKRAADLAGVPYQTYIKLVVFRQALADVREAESIMGRRR